MAIFGYTVDETAIGLGVLQGAAVLEALTVETTPAPAGGFPVTGGTYTVRVGVTRVPYNTLQTSVSASAMAKIMADTHAAIGLLALGGAHFDDAQIYDGPSVFS